jgi:hypothetical protein
MANRKKNNLLPKGTLLIATATEAEALFFSQMRKDCRFTNMNVVHIEAKNLQDFIVKVGREKGRNHYDKAFALFGFDDLSTNVEEVKASKELAEKKRVELAYFNPSFDLWIYLHLAEPRTFVGDKNVFVSALVQKLSGYELTENYLLNKGLNLHMQLFPRHAMADLAARNYNNVAKAQTGLEATTIPELNKAITEICGQADMSHNTKVFN